MTSNLEQLIATIARLRAPDGCPWDREQTHSTLTRFLLEETYEVLEAIHLNDDSKLSEELGDLLLQIVLHSQIAKDEGRFDIEDVARSINEKMIRRHPHVFGESKLATADEVLAQWDDLKAAEKAGASGDSHQDAKPKSALDGVPFTMPALFQALKISEKAVKQGFEWQKEEDIWTQLDSELAELKAEIDEIQDKRRLAQAVDLEAINLEMGDVLFTIVNIARWHDLNPEESLIMAIAKFKKRFQAMELGSNQPLKELNTGQLEELWIKAKATVDQDRKPSVALDSTNREAL